MIIHYDWLNITRLKNARVMPVSVSARARARLSARPCATTSQPRTRFVPGGDGPPSLGPPRCAASALKWPGGVVRCLASAGLGYAPLITARLAFHFKPSQPTQSSNRRPSNAVAGPAAGARPPRGGRARAAALRLGLVTCAPHRCADGGAGPGRGVSGAAPAGPGTG